jgi:hypothetical protein
VITFWTGVEIAIFGYPLLWFFTADITYGIQWALGVIMLGLMLVAILSAFSFDIQKLDNNQDNLHNNKIRTE